MPIAFPKPLDPDQSSSSSESSYDEDEEAAMIQEEWEESLRQMEMVLSIVIFPFFGKWYGRRFSYWVDSGSSASFGSVADIWMDESAVGFMMISRVRKAEFGSA
ncbi:MAG: hypothetical protein TREMPRED_005608 [Tremellales sp. Tagirdzhanova-0007]|nr:MAG: hypothetical protein TREMPRED_005608 [Tremellales sp. Tagirdzhanova-0007]